MSNLYTYQGVEYRVDLLDDGSLDTILLVDNVHQVRLDSAFARDEDGEVRDEAKDQAIESYLESLRETKP